MWTSNKLKITHKITLWYTLLTLALLALLLPIFYLAVSSYLYREEVNRLQAAMAEATSSLEITQRSVKVRAVPNFDPEVPTVVWDARRQVIFASDKVAWMSQAALRDGQIRKVNIKGEIWLVYDKTISEGGQPVADVRVSSSFESIENALTKTQFIIMASVPVYLLLAVLGSLLIARRSLRPIHRITQTARQIGEGDLSRRITQVEQRDEVGELAQTFNGMLDKLEQMFNRERLFSSAASHELRTPVSVMMAYSESMLEDEKRGERTEEDTLRSFEEIFAESKRMNVIISQLLLLTHGDEGRYHLVREPLNLFEIVDAVLQQLEEEAGRSGIELRYQGPDSAALFADQSLLTQMMLNLVENAVKYGKPGGRVTITVEQQKDFTTIQVADDGIGIAASDLPHIFERFYRADKSRDRYGSGLGLSIVSWVVELHQGSVAVESEPGQGTSFTITLPAQGSAEDQAL